MVLYTPLKDGAKEETSVDEEEQTEVMPLTYARLSVLRKPYEPAPGRTGEEFDVEVTTPQVEVRLSIPLLLFFRKFLYSVESHKLSKCFRLAHLTFRSL
jgi:hypothetical protein